jgi:hypothetical protein
MKKLILAALVLAGCTPADQKAADVVKAQVASQMKDPESSKFTNLKVRLATLCGEVNWKNSFGAYAGAEKFRGVDGAITMRSKAESLDAMLKDTEVAKSDGSAVERFDRDYLECQSEGKPVT